MACSLQFPPKYVPNTIILKPLDGTLRWNLLMRVPQYQCREKWSASDHASEHACQEKMVRIDSFSSWKAQKLCTWREKISPLFIVWFFNGENRLSIRPSVPELPICRKRYHVHPVFKSKPESLHWTRGFSQYKIRLAIQRVASLSIWQSEVELTVAEMRRRSQKNLR
jgi:hypothetical protein